MTHFQFALGLSPRRRTRQMFAAAFLAAEVLSSTVFGQVISTVAGGGSLDGFVAASTSFRIGSFGFDRQGTLYLTTNNRFLKVSRDGTLLTLAGDGTLPRPASPGERIVPPDLTISEFCFDDNDNLIYTEPARIRKLSPAGVLTTLAGNGVYGSTGDGGPAIAAQVNLPGGIACANGNVYFFEVASIRRITREGIITTIAKSTALGFGGDGGSALLGQFYMPRALSVDSRGNVFVADSYNRRVRKIDTSGILSTVAGDGTASFSGDGGPATAAAINIVASVAVDAGGELVISDFYNNRIRRVTSGGTINTIAGNGQQGFSDDGGLALDAMLNRPTAIAISPAGEVHFFDSENLRIRKITSDRRIVTVVGADARYFGADGNPAANAQVSPRNPFVDAQGNVYFVDTYRIRRISADGRISTVAGSGVAALGVDRQGDGGPATSADMMPTAVVTDGAGNIYIADGFRVRKVSTNGVITTFAGGGFLTPPATGSIPATDARLSDGVSSLLFDAAGNLLVGCYGSIYKITPGGQLSLLLASDMNATFAAGNSTTPRFGSPQGMANDAVGNLYFSDSTLSRIFKVTPAGTASRVAGPDDPGAPYATDGNAATSGSLGDLRGPIAVSADGSLYFTDAINHRLRKVTPQGIVLTIAGNGTAGYGGDGGNAAAALLSRPNGVALNPSGDLYVAETERIRKISSWGGANYSDMWWAGTIENGWGMSIAQHASGMQFNSLYIYDSTGEPRWYVMPGGTWSDGFTTFQGALYQPTGAPLDAYASSTFKPGSPVGSATIRFTSNLVAELSVTMDGVVTTKRMTRMNFYGGIPSRSVADMWWGGESENGWGINIAQQGGTLFALWYTYGRDGKARWFPMPGGEWNGSGYTGSLFSTSGPRWSGTTYDASVLRVERVGAITLDFTSPDTATLRYAFTSGPFAGVNQSKPLQRMGY